MTIFQLTIFLSWSTDKDEQFLHWSVGGESLFVAKDQIDRDISPISGERRRWIEWQRLSSIDRRDETRRDEANLFVRLKKNWREAKGLNPFRWGLNKKRFFLTPSIHLPRREWTLLISISIWRWSNHWRRRFIRLTRSQNREEKHRETIDMFLLQTFRDEEFFEQLSRMTLQLTRRRQLQHWGCGCGPEIPVLVAPLSISSVEGNSPLFLSETSILSMEVTRLVSTDWPMKIEKKFSCQTKIVPSWTLLIIDLNGSAEELQILRWSLHRVLASPWLYENGQSRTFARRNEWNYRSDRHWHRRSGGNERWVGRVVSHVLRVTIETRMMSLTEESRLGWTTIVGSFNRPWLSMFHTWQSFSSVNEREKNSSIDWLVWKEQWMFTFNVFNSFQVNVLLRWIVIGDRIAVCVHHAVTRRREEKRREVNFKILLIVCLLFSSLTIRRCSSRFPDMPCRE